MHIRSDNQDVERLAGFLDRGGEQQDDPDSDIFSERWREFGPWLLLLCVPLAPLAFRRGLLALLIAMGPTVAPAPVAAAGWFATPDQAAQRAFRREQFEAAANEFHDPDWRAAAAYRAGDFEASIDAVPQPANAEQHYNQGNALARLGRYEDAIAAYDEALQLVPEHDDAQHNKDLARATARRTTSARLAVEQRRSTAKRR